MRMRCAVLQAQGMCPNITSTQEYARHTLSNAAYDELDTAIKSSHWLQWEHLDQVRVGGGGGNGAGVRCVLV